MTVASTTTGKVQGLEKDGVHQFRGIRFATAARFRPPQPVEPWHDVYDATSFGPILPQNPSGLESMLGKADSTPMDEDALYLNVFTPAVDDRPRPVMVWIHGGGFTAGAGSIPWYSGANLARRGNAVIVTINYRLGAFGFLHLEDVLGAEFAGAGNNGLRDQIAAIEWVRDNITSFGGDPGNITLFGESAGAMSIGTLLGVPGVPEMIRSAIPQSGAADTVDDAERASLVTEAMLTQLGLTPGSAAALLEVPQQELLDAQAAVGTDLAAAGTLRLPFAPVLDGTVLTRPPLDAVRDGAAAHVRLLVGTTSDEYRLFSLMDRAGGSMSDGKLTGRVGRAVGPERAAEVVDVYRGERPGAANDDIWCDFATDWIFRIPAIRLAEAQSTHQADTYSYLFSYKSTAFDGALGACHAIDVPFAFDNLDRRGVDMLLGGITDDTLALGRATADAWLSMAKSGSPQHDDLPEWQPYSSSQRAVMELGTTRQVLDDPGSAERELWASLLD